MTSYIARSGGEKKKNILRQKELALRGDIRREVAEEKLHRSAEKVRLAQLGVIKALSHEAEPARSEDEERVADTLKRLEEAEEYWTDVLVEEIIEMYSTDGEEDVFIDRKKWWDFRPRRN
jgi:chromosomal replication initiation ATPase DnaA